MIEIQTQPSLGGEQDFAYIVSHDLRGSARALSELPVWIREDLGELEIPLPGAVSESLDMLERHAKRMDQMLVDLLAYSRAGQGASVEPVAFASLLEDMRAGLELSSSVTLHVGDVEGVVHVSKKDAQTLLHVLIDNAVTHGSAPNVRIELSARVAKDMVHLVLEDDGPGIAPDMMDKAFLPMKTGQRRDDVEGSGMGLAIAKKIVASANGTLFAGQSERLGGLRVEMRFPNGVG